MECAKASPAVRKGKKKNVKDELDRIKQAEKKKRRLEKALATSAAIRFELEKKKQKKKEEQQKLDEEGAAIAEAVALHVLVGEESDDSRELLLKKDKESNQWDLVEGTQWISGPNGDGCIWNEQENTSWMVSSVPLVGNEHHQWFDVGNWEVQRISAGLLAAQAVSSLQIAGDAPVTHMSLIGCCDSELENLNVYHPVCSTL
ncbi:putative deSI-like protein-like [Capsicum annuum]|nr:putative deSI-like protein-like [Capsicum annuum]